MEEQAISNFQGALLDVFMRAVDGITGLEGDDASPTAFPKVRSRLRGISSVLSKGKIARTIKQTNAAPKQAVSLIVKDPYSGVSIFDRAINQLRFDLLVISEFLPEMEHAKKVVGLVEGDICAFGQPTSLLNRHWQGDGNGPCIA